MMNLAYWQDRLAKHFAQLRATRHADGGDNPIFALEHGLDETDRQELATAVRSHAASSAPSGDHTLPWTVYATELGYRYSGDEYWQTFESETPGWTSYGDRYWIRDCFQSFHRTFGGAKPSGAWARHFSIIAWPITHAILPRDLQFQLARILYELRYSFSAALFESPSALGGFIAARSWNATSRFQNLAQETLLVGQIAAALLLQGEFGTGSLIHSATLCRIGDDLDRQRRAREWLHGARRYAKERVHILGLGQARGPTSSTARHPDDARAEIAALGIEPRLLLRPTDASSSSWEPHLEIPDLSHLLIRFPRVREILTGSRCRVAGAAGRPLARGQCLHGAQAVRLARWPRTDEVLLQFDQTDPQLDYLLRTECLLRPGQMWLFRIASDDLAYELRSLRVRPGERYIICSTAGSVASNAYVRPVVLECEGIYGAMLDLPAALSEDWEVALRSLGLRQAKAIEVWPAGLAAVVWDGEGHGEWLASEQPCLGIRTDYPVETLLVSMAGSTEPTLELTPVLPGEPIFIELPLLSLGLHTLRVFARSGPAAEAELLGDLEVVLRIREARPWSSGVSLHGPLHFQLDPPAPTLEQVWEGRVEVTLRGPTGRQAKCRVSLFEKGTDPATVVKELPPIALPVTPADWRGHFEKYFRETQEAQDAYDTARICEIEFRADELAAFNVRCEREFTPVRWAVRRHGQSHSVRLIDDSGNTVRPALARLAFETPACEELLESAPEYDVPAVGGLYVARSGEFTAAVIVPPVIRGLVELRCLPHLDVPERSAEALIRAVKLAQLWGSAKLTGNLFSATRQRDVLRALALHLSRTLGGETWLRAEAAAQGRHDGLAELASSVSKGREGGAIGITLAREWTALTVGTCTERVDRFTPLALRFLSLAAPAPKKLPGSTAILEARRPAADDPTWLSELALRLASDPAGVEAWAGHGLRAGLGRLLEVPTLARAARFLVIASDLQLPSRVATGELYAGWRWT